MASLLVIGGSGFIGKSILGAYQKNLLDKWEINTIYIASRNASNLQITNGELLNDSIKLLDVDIETCINLPKADIVIFAADSVNLNPIEINEDKSQLKSAVNINNFSKIARKLYKNNKIIFLSSGAVYGKLPDSPFKVNESYPLLKNHHHSQIKNDYSYGKILAEKIFRNLGNDGLNVSIARCFSFIGPYLPRQGAYAIGNFIEDGIQSRPIRINADHHVYRSYMFADDLVIWLMTLAEYSSPLCPIYNVGSDSNIEIHDLAQIISDYFNVPILSTIYKDNASNNDNYIPDISLAKNIFGLDLQTNINNAIQSTVESIRHLKN